MLDSNWMRTVPQRLERGDERGPPFARGPSPDNVPPHEGGASSGVSQVHALHVDSTQLLRQARSIASSDGISVPSDRIGTLTGSAALPRSRTY